MDDATGELLDFRARKDAFFRTPDSPLSAQARANFAGLAYYPPDEAYRVLVEVERSGSGETIDLGTTTGELRPFVRYGAAHVKLPPGAARLALYAQPGDEPSRLFVPFRDASSGSETYGAGRYLDAELHASIVLLDFNYAYLPYCAYGEGWSCPLPPRENWLSVAVRAGERGG